MCNRILELPFLDMTDRERNDELQQFFEPHEISDLREAFKTDKEEENMFLKGYYIRNKIQFHLDFIKLNISELELNDVDGTEVLKYAINRYLGTQINVWDEVKPLTVTITATDWT